MKQPKYQGILFDLDGTLVDTAPDLAAALNHVLASNGKQPLSLKTIQPTVSHGGAALIQLGFPELDEQQKEALRLEFVDYYINNIANHSKLFKGIKEILIWIKQNNLKWGIVTNKPEWLSLPLLKQLNFPLPYSTLVCGDTYEFNKPHPLPMLKACEQMNLTPQQCIYIGDAKRDIEAAQNTNMHSVIAAYGYIEDNENISEWKATHIVTHAKNILNIIT